MVIAVPAPSTRELDIEIETVVVWLCSGPTPRNASKPAWTVSVVTLFVALVVPSDDHWLSVCESVSGLLVVVGSRSISYSFV